MFSEYALHYRWRHCVYVRVMYETATCCVWANSKYVIIRLDMKLLFEPDTIWMCCPNTLKWRWRLRVCVLWMYGTVPSWDCTNSGYACIGACLTLTQYTFVIDHTLMRIHCHCNGNGGIAFMFVECMERCRVDPGQKGGKFVIMCARIWRCH